MHPFEKKGDALALQHPVSYFSCGLSDLSNYALSRLNGLFRFIPQPFFTTGPCDAVECCRKLLY